MKILENMRKLCKKSTKISGQSVLFGDFE